MWRQRFERAHGATVGTQGDGEKLHFLLGISGGGVDHLTRLLSQPGLKVRFYNSPLAKFEPKLVLNPKGDRLAQPYQRAFEPSFPLFRIYRMLVGQDSEWAIENMGNRLSASDMMTAPCLIKESRALLATEGLLDGLKAKAFLYLGDPVKIIDQLFGQQGLDASYLKSEARSILSPYFLARFMRRDSKGVIESAKKIRDIADRRERTILHRVMLVALIQHMFRRLSLRYPRQVVLVESDQLLQRPGLLPELLRRLMRRRGETLGQEVLEVSTFVPAGGKEAVWKDAWPDAQTEYDFLTEEEAETCYTMLREAGLGVGVREREHEEPLPSEKMVEDIYAEFLDVGNG